MRSTTFTAALLLCLGCLLSGPASAAGVCQLSSLTYGGLDQPDCTIKAEDLLSAYEMYKARQRGLVVYTPPKLPNLVVTNLREGNGAGNTVIDAQARVDNTGTASAPPFEVLVQAQFVKLDDGSVVSSAPVTLPMSGLAAGARAWSPWLHQVAYILIPDPDHDYDVILRAIVDPRNRIVEQSELDNVYEEVCRIPGYGDGQGRPLDAGQDFC